MKRKLSKLLFIMMVVCIPLLGVSCSKGKTARWETVEYRVLSSRLIKSKGSVVLYEQSMGGSETSPCSFKVPMQHDCETVLSGGTKCSENMNLIKSRIEVIRSDDDIPEGLKVKIAEHLGVKLGKVFAGGGGVLAAGPAEFDDTKFRALFIVGVAAIEEEYEIVYSSDAVGGEAAQENGVERKATVSVYKNIATFSKIRLYSKDSGKLDENDNEHIRTRHALEMKSYMRDDIELMALKGKYEKGTNDAEGHLAQELVSVWKRIYAKEERASGTELKEIAFKEDGSCELSIITSDGSSQKYNCTFEILLDNEQKRFPGRKPLILLSVNDADMLIPLVDVSVDYDSRFPTTNGTILKFLDLDEKEFCFAR